jgi:hypothetical protein
MRSQILFPEPAGFHFARGTLLENAQRRAESLSKMSVDDDEK